MGCGQSRLPVSPPEYTVDGKAIDASGAEPSAASGLDSLHRTASSQNEQSALGGGSTSVNHQSSHKSASDTPVAGSVAAGSPGQPSTAPEAEAAATQKHHNSESSLRQKTQVVDTTSNGEQKRIVDTPSAAGSCAEQQKSAGRSVEGAVSNGNTADVGHSLKLPADSEVKAQNHTSDEVNAAVTWTSSSGISSGQPQVLPSEKRATTGKHSEAETKVNGDQQLSVALGKPNRWGSIGPRAGGPGQGVDSTHGTAAAGGASIEAGAGDASLMATAGSRGAMTSLLSDGRADSDAVQLPRAQQPADSNSSSRAANMNRGRGPSGSSASPERNQLRGAAAAANLALAAQSTDDVLVFSRGAVGAARRHRMLQDQLRAERDRDREREGAGRLAAASASQSGAAHGGAQQFLSRQTRQDDVSKSRRTLMGLGIDSTTVGGVGRAGSGSGRGAAGSSAASPGPATARRLANEAPDVSLAMLLRGGLSRGGGGGGGGGGRGPFGGGSAARRGTLRGRLGGAKGKGQEIVPPLFGSGVVVDAAARGSRRNIGDGGGQSGDSRRMLRALSSNAILSGATPSLLEEEAVIMEGLASGRDIAGGEDKGGQSGAGLQPPRAALPSGDVRLLHASSTRLQATMPAAHTAQAALAGTREQQQQQLESPHSARGEQSESSAGGGTGATLQGQSATHAGAGAPPLQLQAAKTSVEGAAPGDKANQSPATERKTAESAAIQENGSGSTVKPSDTAPRADSLNVPKAPPPFLAAMGRRKTTTAAPQMSGLPGSTGGGPPPFLSRGGAKSLGGPPAGQMPPHPGMLKRSKTTGNERVGDDGGSGADGDGQSPPMPLPARSGFKNTALASSGVRHIDHDTQIVNQYLLSEQIGKGAFGEVRKAVSQMDGKAYAVKILNKSVLSRKSMGRFGNALQSVKREVAIHKMLDHPNVVRLHEVIDSADHDRIYMVSDLVPGGALQPDALEAAPLPLAEARHYFAQLVAAMQYLHFNRVVHRDIKPGNLLANRKTRELKVADFGVSHVHEEGGDGLRSTAGTAAFTSPEMTEGGVFSGKKADVWAVGCSLYMMLYGRPPFVAKRIYEIFDAIVEKEVEFEDGRLDRTGAHCFGVPEQEQAREQKESGGMVARAVSEGATTSSTRAAMTRSRGTRHAEGHDGDFVIPPSVHMHATTSRSGQQQGVGSSIERMSSTALDELGEELDEAGTPPQGTTAEEILKMVGRAAGVHAEPGDLPVFPECLAKDTAPATLTDHAGDAGAAQQEGGEGEQNQNEGTGEGEGKSASPRAGSPTAVHGGDRSKLKPKPEPQPTPAYMAGVALAKDLIRRMLIKDPSKRPTIDEVALHPFLTTSRHAVSAIQRGRGRSMGQHGSRRRLLPTAEEVDNAITSLLTFRGIVKARNISKLLLRQARRRIAAKLKVVHVFKKGSPRFEDRSKEDAAVGGEQKKKEGDQDGRSAAQAQDASRGEHCAKGSEGGGGDSEAPVREPAGAGTAAASKVLPDSSSAAASNAKKESGAD